MVQSALDFRGSRRWAVRLLIGLLVLALVLGGAWSWFTLNWAYAEGERAGILQKFARKGWLCKTYEGELALYIVGGVAPEIWHFSTRDEALAQELTANVGRQMRVRYSEHRGVPTKCFAETPYFAESFTLVQGQWR
jgi:hypothetical protein